MEYDNLEEQKILHNVILVKGSQNTIFLEEAIKEILADKKDTIHLCRQSDFWMKAKETNPL